MLDHPYKQIAAAIENGDYPQAEQLLQALRENDPDDLWGLFYTGWLQEATDQLEAAGSTYRQLLQGTTNAKLISQARQRIARLDALATQRHQEALARAIAHPEAQIPGVLVLEPIPAQNKPQAAQRLAQILQLDPYNARLQLPSRGWRLLRTGATGELQVYANALQQAQIPCFCVSLSALDELHIFQVHYFQEQGEQATVRCQNQHGQQGTLTFAWSEVSRQVKGQVPLIEAVVDLDARRKLQRKTRTLDYAQFCDLHLPQRKSILRLGDRTYSFQRGATATSLPKKTTRENWNSLMAFLNQQLPPIPVWSDFNPFAETALGFGEMLEHLRSPVELNHRRRSLWEPAFHLYSGLVYYREHDRA